VPDTHITDPDAERIRDAALRARVAAIVDERPAPSPDPWWERLGKNTLLTTLVGFVLTGLIGSCIADRYQRNQARERFSAEVRETRRTAKLALMDTVNRSLNTGYYVFGRYYDAIRGREPRDTVRSRRARFDDFNARFESQAIADAAKLCAFFGRSANQRFVSLANSIASLNFQLRQYELNPNSDHALAGLNSLRARIFDFSSGLAGAIRDDSTAGGAVTSQEERGGCNRPERAEPGSVIRANRL
jgi:hypothetical protein